MLHPASVPRDRLEIARILREIGALLEIDGTNPWRARAYVRGAEAIEELGPDFEALADRSRLTEVPGIGAALAAQIAEIRAGGSKLHAALSAKYPPGVLELVGIRGLGLPKIRALHEALGIDGIDALERACRAGEVRAVRGFGPRSEASLLSAIAEARVREERVLLVEAEPIARRLLAHVRALPTSRAEIAGESRRGVESTTAIVIVATGEDLDALAAHVARAPLLDRVEIERVEGPATTWPVRHGTGSKPIEVRGLVASHGLRALVLVVEPSAFATTLFVATGPTAHVDEVLPRVPPASAAFESEPSIYARAGLPFVPPELRDLGDALERASVDLVEETDLRGLVHVHSDWSDGKDDLLALARAADALGASYVTITDHSGAAHYARGLDEERLRRQWDAIAEVQEQVSVRLLRGSEVDILDDGALDWPDRILERLDVVIASLHSGLRMDERQMTDRLVRAMRHPIRKIWGHPLGRLVERRAPVACRVEEVLDAAAETGAAIEINGDPYRLDLPPRWIPAARQRGLRFVLSVDAHSTIALRNGVFAVRMARRGGLARSDVLNARPVEEFLRAVRPTG
jgi:DNA polymerase (family 10)